MVPITGHPLYICSLLHCAKGRVGLVMHMPRHVPSLQSSDNVVDRGRYSSVIHTAYTYTIGEKCKKKVKKS